ncbi:hypothetical protein L596_019736 [Steinernema carpocapsae]|uniref:G-protein coupled receptors family 1 profile domain-containing protein n=1 Tax=Steinernema carpocapsae TaxID=34508 RepID=A0A4U5MRY4_STECR|nr:hypothetical protein L596_019736 [Steinernema carpocapsae]
MRQIPLLLTIQIFIAWSISSLHHWHLIFPLTALFTAAFIKWARSLFSVSQRLKGQTPSPDRYFIWRDKTSAFPGLINSARTVEEVVLMLMAFAMVLLFISAALCLTSLFVLVLLFHRKSLPRHWSDSPVMALLFLVTLVTSIVYFVFSIQWILVSFDQIHNVPKNAVFLLLPGLALVTTRTLYDAAHIGVYVQRICYLKFPTRSTNSMNKIVIGGVFGTAVPAMAVLVYFHLVTMPQSGNPIPEGSFMGAIVLA